jgi:uncharacterized delta-60 repeat protein
MNMTRWLTIAGMLLISACVAQTAPAGGDSPGAPSIAYASVAIAPGAQCANGGIRVDMGIDDNRNGRLDPAEIDASEYVCNGADGAAGAPGATALVRTTPEPAGLRCAAGGVLIESGVDVDRDGVLDPSEVSTSQYVCNGANGTAGSAGSAGGTALTRLIPEAAGSHCPTGGLRVESGVDADRDGILDPSEVTTFQYVCNGSSPGATPPVITAAGVVTGDASFAGTLATGDYLVGDGTRADFFAFTTSAPGVLEAVANVPLVELHVFDASCRAIPDVADWGTCYLGPASGHPALPPGDHVLMVKGAATTSAWQSIPYRVDVRLWANLAGMATGILDDGFGAGGLACAPTVGSGDDRAFGVAVQSDQRIVLALAEYGPPGGAGGPGPAPSPPVVFTPVASIVRFDATGAIDPSFDGDGVVTWAGSPSAFLLQGDDKVVVAGASAAGLELRRFLDSGAPDGGFGAGGVATLDVGTPSAYLNAIAASTGGTVATGVWQGAPSDTRILLLRSGAAGGLDGNFAGSGYATIAGLGADGRAVAVQGDGKIVVAAATDYSPSTVTVIARYDASGALDPSFDGDGIATTDGTPDALFVLPSGEIVVTGYGGSPSRMRITRFGPDGGLRSVAPLSGTLPSDPSWQPFGIRTVLASADRLLVLVAACTTSSIGCGAPYVGMVSRYSLDGKLDIAFGGGGWLLLPDFAPSDATVMADGRIVLAGDRLPSGSPPTQPCVVRIR